MSTEPRRHTHFLEAATAAVYAVEQLEKMGCDLFSVDIAHSFDLPDGWTVTIHANKHTIPPSLARVAEFARDPSHTVDRMQTLAVAGGARIFWCIPKAKTE